MLPGFKVASHGVQLLWGRAREVEGEVKSGGE